MSNTLWTYSQLARRTAGALLVAAALLVPGAAAPAPAQLTFDNPDKAAEALVAAAKAGDTAQILNILGPGGSDIIDSGDPVADKNRRDDFIEAYDAKHSIAPDS